MPWTIMGPWSSVVAKTMERKAEKKKMNTNRKAFLDMIAVSEIGKGLLAVSDDGYDVLVGSTPSKPLLFKSYITHPNVYHKAMNSTAAGRYQFLFRYWKHYQRSLGLEDFGKECQDRWAVALINECHALDDVDEGRVADAMHKCRSRWASLPGAGYGQHENSAAKLLVAYQESGGVIT